MATTTRDIPSVPLSANSSSVTSPTVTPTGVELGRRTRRLPRRRRGADVGPLRRVPSLRQADERRLADLAPHADMLRLPAGTAIVRGGEFARQLVAIVSGEAEARWPDGRLTVLPAGTELGHELLTGGRHPATVVAGTAVEVVVVTAPAARWAHAEGIADLAPPA